MKVTALNVAWAAARALPARRFRSALRNPDDVQRGLLDAHLKRGANSAWGREHGYADITSPAQFRSRVPITDWATLQPWVERIERGEENVLTCEPVLMLERTSGSASGPKHIPYTATLLAEFGSATAPWLDDVFRAFPALFLTRQYWSVSPVAREQERTSGGVRIGLEDDTEYFDAATRFALKQLFAVDGSVARERSMDVWRQRTLSALLAAEDLGFISIWNPSFLTLLMDSLVADWSTWEPKLSRRQRAAVQREGRVVGEALWPNLELISCWTDAWAAHAVPALRRHFPVTPFQGKGLLATEGVVSFPLWGQPAPVAAVTSHFLEFESLDARGKVFGVEALRVDATYAPLITTGNGFARYRLADVVRCVGFLGATPLLKFEGRLDRTADLRGEKLDATFVERAIQDVLTMVAARFAFVAPELLEPPRYVVFLENPRDAGVFARALEEKFRTQTHYAYARDLGQLGAVEARVVNDGEAKRVKAMQARGMRLGDIKPAGFDPTPGWVEHFR